MIQSVREAENTEPDDEYLHISDFKQIEWIETMADIHHSIEARVQNDDDENDKVSNDIDEVFTVSDSMDHAYSNGTTSNQT